MRAVLQTEILTTAEQLEALEPEWLELWRRAPDATPFQSPAWLLPWWRHFGSHELSVITVRENGQLSGVAPLYVLREDDESLGMLLGTGTSDYLDVVATGDVSPIVDEMLGIDCQ